MIIKAKETPIWELSYGRMSYTTVILGAESFEEAVDLSVVIIKHDKTEWKNVDRNDIVALKRIDKSVFIKEEDE